MIKSVYHQTVHSTFQYMMRPSLKLGLLQWSHFGEQLFFFIVFFICSLTNYCCNGNTSHLANDPILKKIDLKCKHTQTVLCFACGIFTEIFK